LTKDQAIVSIVICPAKDCDVQWTRYLSDGTNLSGGYQHSRSMWQTGSPAVICWGQDIYFVLL